MNKTVPKKELDVIPQCDMRCCSIYGCSLMPEDYITWACFYVKDCLFYRVELLD